MWQVEFHHHREASWLPEVADGGPNGGLGDLIQAAGHDGRVKEHVAPSMQAPRERRAKPVSMGQNGNPAPRVEATEAAAPRAVPWTTVIVGAVSALGCNYWLIHMKMCIRDRDTRSDAQHGG